jgi:uncharacterized protein YqgV (UPF0045/DUF77 family)
MAKSIWPSKNVGIVAGVCFLVIGVTIYVNYYGPTDRNNQNAASTQNTSNKQDTDKDGIPDWQEDLYGTNPQVADTDNDGTNDSEEIARGRDPLSDARDDSFSLVATSSNETNQNTKTNLTSQAANRLLPQAATLAQAKSDGKDVPLGSVQKNISATVTNLNQEIPTIGKSDITVIQNPSRTNIERYYANLYSIILKAIEKEVSRETPELGLMNQLVAQNQEATSTRQKLQTRAEFYGGLAAKITNIRVPQMYTTEHINVVNHLKEISYAIDNVRLEETDPVKAALALDTYEQATDDLQTVTNDLFAQIKQSLQ